MSGEQSPGLVFDLAPEPAPSPEGGVWGSLREVPPSKWLRLIPGVLRQVFSGREPVGGLPIVEPGHTRPQELAEVDFDPGAPITDHTPTAEAHAAEPAGAEFAVEESLAEAPTAEAATVEPPAAEPVAAEAVQQLIAEPLVAEATVAEATVAEAANEAGAELGEAGLEAGL